MDDESINAELNSLRSQIGQFETKISGLQSQYNELLNKIKLASASIGMPAQLSVTSSIHSNDDTVVTSSTYYGPGYAIISTSARGSSFAALEERYDVLTVTVDGVTCPLYLYLKKYTAKHTSTTEGRSRAFTNEYNQVPFNNTIQFSLPRDPAYSETANFSIYKYIL